MLFSLDGCSEFKKLFQLITFGISIFLFIELD